MKELWISRFKKKMPKSWWTRKFFSVMKETNRNWSEHFQVIFLTDLVVLESPWTTFNIYIHEMWVRRVNKKKFLSVVRFYHFNVLTMCGRMRFFLRYFFCVLILLFYTIIRRRYFIFFSLFLYIQCILFFSLNYLHRKFRTTQESPLV